MNIYFYQQNTIFFNSKEKVKQNITEIIKYLKNNNINESNEQFTNSNVSPIKRLVMRLLLTKIKIAISDQSKIVKILHNNLQVTLEINHRNYENSQAKKQNGQEIFNYVLNLHHILLCEDQKEYFILKQACLTQTLTCESQRTSTNRFITDLANSFQRRQKKCSLNAFQIISNDYDLYILSYLSNPFRSLLEHKCQSYIHTLVHNLNHNKQHVIYFSIYKFTFCCINYNIID
ncbi:hypothetical protein pb186bvf_015568 [Paramecium bursaria]